MSDDAAEHVRGDWNGDLELMSKMEPMIEDYRREWREGIDRDLLNVRDEMQMR